MIQSNLYKEVVQLGLTCGLNTPQEWIRNYDLHLLELHSYHDIPEINRELKTVSRSLYEACHPFDDSNVSDSDIERWVWEKDDTYL